ncbi:hypothetical protein BST61_g6880 [Cercospora zeina]
MSTRRPDWVSNRMCVSEEFGVYGTPGYMAPEELGYRAAGGDESVNLSSATDVYAIGAVFYEVLTGMPLPSISDEETGIDLYNPETVRQMQFEPPALDATARAYYSQEMRDLIYAMMRHVATARPSFRKILKTAHKFADSPRNRARGLRDAPADGPQI